MVNTYAAQSGGCRFESLWGFGFSLKGAYYEVGYCGKKTFLAGLQCTLTSSCAKNIRNESFLEFHLVYISVFPTFFSHSVFDCYRALLLWPNSLKASVLTNINVKHFKIKNKSESNASKSLYAVQSVCRARHWNLKVDCWIPDRSEIFYASSNVPKLLSKRPCYRVQKGVVYYYLLLLLHLFSSSSLLFN